jgi:hypothetical protein
LINCQLAEQAAVEVVIKPFQVVQLHKAEEVAQVLQEPQMLILELQTQVVEVVVVAVTERVVQQIHKAPQVVQVLWSCVIQTLMPTSLQSVVV